MPLCIVAIIYLVSTNEGLTSVSAGLAILLFGMLSLGSGFRTFNGGFLENILTNSTNTSVKAITFGTIATAIMQSSSLVCVLSISFVSASLISLTQSIGVIFGANLGNSVGSWIIASVSTMKISALALPLVVGGVLFNFQNNKTAKGIGQILLGIGFFFLGVSYIKEGFEEYQEMIDFSKYSVDGIKGVLIFVMLGALMTGIVQSSHATLTIIISAFVTGSMTYENAIAATLGTSVGGVVTALVASLSTNIDGKRLAVSNCIFNFSIAIIVIATFDYFVWATTTISALIGLGEGNPLRLAVFHTLFNLVAVLLFLPLIPKISALVEKVLKEKDSQTDKPLYINKTIIRYQDTAFIALVNEVKHLYENTYELIAHSLGCSRTDINSDKDMKQVLRGGKIWRREENEIEIEVFYIKKIKVLFNAIIEFAIEAQTNTQDPSYVRKFELLASSARHMVEAIKNMELLQPNLKKHSTSKVLVLADEYNDIRIHLAILLRNIQKILKDEDNIHPEEAILKLKEQKKVFKEMDKNAVKYVESLLIKKEINAQNGTSLLNAAGFSNEVAKELSNAIIQIQKTRIGENQEITKLKIGRNVKEELKNSANEEPKKEK